MFKSQRFDKDPMFLLSKILNFQVRLKFTGMYLILGNSQTNYW